MIMPDTPNLVHRCEYTVVILGNDGEECLTITNAPEMNGRTKFVFTRASADGTLVTVITDCPLVSMHDVLHAWIEGWTESGNPPRNINEEVERSCRVDKIASDAFLHFLEGP